MQEGFVGEGQPWNARRPELTDGRGVGAGHGLAGAGGKVVHEEELKISVRERGGGRGSTW